MRFVVKNVKICVTNYAYQNITRNTFEVFSVTAATKNKIHKRADKMPMVEENDDHYVSKTVI
jgi:hypothetical protein